MFKQNAIILTVSGLLHLGMLLLLFFVSTSSPASRDSRIELTLWEKGYETEIEELQALDFESAEMDSDESPELSFEVQLTNFDSIGIAGIGNSGAGQGRGIKSSKRSDSRIELTSISKEATHSMDATGFGYERSKVKQIDLLRDRISNRQWFLKAVSRIEPECVVAVAFFPMENTDFEKIQESDHSNNRDFLVSQSDYYNEYVLRAGHAYKCDLALVLYRGKLPEEALRGIIDLARIPMRVVCIKNSAEIDQSVEKLADEALGEYRRM